MNCFVDLNLTALEPLIVTNGSAESVSHAALPYVPGNMLLGALAAAWARLHRGENPDDSPEFQNLFLRGLIFYGHAVPLCGGDPSLPNPACFLRRKNRKAMPEENAAEGDYRIANSLLVDSEESLRDVFGEKDRVKVKRLPAGFFNPRKFWRAANRQTWNVHVALGRQRSHLEGQLFAFSALAAGSLFQSRIVCASRKLADALLALLAKTGETRVGHSRSAGYGLAELAVAGEGEEERKTVKGKTHILYLRSQYLPNPSWANPEENLARSIGVKGRFTRQFADFCRIQGYNSFWNKPRASRSGLDMGGVFVLECEDETELVTPLYLGSWRSEGYGRIDVDPPFLAELQPQIAPRSPIEIKKARDPAPTPLLRLLRERAAARQALALSERWLSLWSDFLKAAADSPRPTRNQRNNLRYYDKRQFEEALSKTPGKQWLHTAAVSPLAGGRKDFLSNIFLKVLDRDEFLKSKAAPGLDTLRLPGGPPTPEEKQKFASEAHRLFVRRLAALWAKQGRQ